MVVGLNYCMALAIIAETLPHVKLLTQITLGPSLVPRLASDPHACVGPQVDPGR